MTALPPRTPWVLALARRYARRRLARGLDGLHVRGLDRARAAAARGPVIFAANHVGWWDTFLILALDEALGTESYALMDEEGMRRLPFFGRLGALPLRRGAGAGARAGLREGAAKLDRPGRVLWVFPQGRHRPAHLRPLGFEPGIRLLARMAPGAAVVPVAFQYAFGEHPVPAAYACFGAPLPSGPAFDVDGCERALESALDEVDRMLAGGGPPFDALVPSRARLPQRTPWARLLARLSGKRPASAEGGAGEAARG